MPRKECKLKVNVGDRFGKLVYVERAGHDAYGVAKIKCICDCGGEKIGTVSYFKHGGCNSCGCDKRGFNTEDLTGRVFNALTIVGLPQIIKNRYLYPCICQCGQKRDVRLDYLQSGKTRSCGCGIDYFQSSSYKEMEKLVGTKKDHITITRLIVNKRSAKFEYRCDCGNMGIIVKKSLKTIVSCGCMSPYTYSGYEDVTGTYMNKVKEGAVRRNLEFNITAKDVWDKYIEQNKKCALSGQDIVFNRRYYRVAETQNASVDRIDSSRGYTKDNIQILHKDVNQIKWDFTDQEFIDICEKVTEYQKQKDKNK